MPPLSIALVARHDGLIFDRVALALEWSLTERGCVVTRYEGLAPEIHNEDATLYLPYYFMVPGIDKCSLAYFTHLEDTPDMAEKRVRFQQVAANATVCIAQSRKTAGHLPPWKTTVLELPATPDYLTAKKEINLFLPIVKHPNDRKNLAILQGHDVEGINLLYTAGNVPQDEMPSWYNKVDYVLVTGRNEGGPMAVKEALAMGKPVIAPDVGWAWDYPVIRYSGKDELGRILKQIAPQPQAWEQFADGVHQLALRSKEWQTSRNSPASTS